MVCNENYERLVMSGEMPPNQTLQGTFDPSATLSSAKAAIASSASERRR